MPQHLTRKPNYNTTSKNPYVCRIVSMEEQFRGKSWRIRFPDLASALQVNKQYAFSYSSYKIHPEYKYENYAFGMPISCTQSCLLRQQSNKSSLITARLSSLSDVLIQFLSSTFFCFPIVRYSSWCNIVPESCCSRLGDTSSNHRVTASFCDCLWEWTVIPKWIVKSD